MKQPLLQEMYPRIDSRNSQYDILDSPQISRRPSLAPETLPTGGSHPSSRRASLVLEKTLGDEEEGLTLLGPEALGLQPLEDRCPTRT